MPETPPSGGNGACGPPRTRRNRKWPCGLVELAVALWTENRLSASEMAKKLGITKNALIGKAHRLGWPTHKPLPRARKPIPPKRAPAVPAPLVEAVPPTEPRFLGLSLIQLKASSCRYPRGEAAPYSFCGQRKKDGSAYCPFHHRIVYLAVSARRPLLHIPEPWTDRRP